LPGKAPGGAEEQPAVTLYALCFYLSAAVILAATVLAITRRHPVHAVVYLSLSFLGSSLLFYLLGAPFLAALEILIYAGAIMVLFLFVVMMLKVEETEVRGLALRPWAPALILGLAFLSVVVLLAANDPASPVPLRRAVVAPRAFGGFIFERYWFAVELVSLLLLVGLMAAVHLGRGRRDGTAAEEERP
jgi:NADH-quinone oxidoreductase subunit J